MSEPAGWYTNPDGTTSERYWDGARWTHEVRPVPVQPVAASLPPMMEPPETAEYGSGWSSSAQAATHINLASDGAIPPPDPGVGSFVPPPVRSSNDSPADLFAVLFDFSFERRITRPIARWAYILGTGTILAVVLIMFVFSVQAGGPGAVLSVILWPLLGILSLVYLRSALQTAVAAAEAEPDESGDAADSAHQ